MRLAREHGARPPALSAGPRKEPMTSPTLLHRQRRILDADQFVGPNAFADLLGFLGMDQDLHPAGPTRMVQERRRVRAPVKLLQAVPAVLLTALLL